MIFRRLATALFLLLAACGSTAVSSEPTIQVEGSFTTFGSLKEMIDASSMIFVGSVIEVADGRFDPAPEGEGFKGYQDLEVTIQVNEALSGEVSNGDQVTIPWFGYVVNSDGTRGPQQVVGGQLPPIVGETNVWFLGNGDGGTFGLIAFEGRLQIDESNRLIVDQSVHSGASSEVSGKSIDELKAIIVNEKPPA